MEDPAVEATLVEGDGNIASQLFRVARDMLNKNQRIHVIKEEAT